MPPTSKGGFIEVLRRQPEEYIKEELGSEYLIKVKAKTDLKKINS